MLITVRTRRKLFVLLSLLAISLFANTAQTTVATFSYGETVIIHSDGSVTPASAPIARNGETYVVTDDILMPRSTNEGLIVERDNIVLDGAGHKVQGNGQSSAILVEGRTGVTLTRFLLQGFYWGLEIRDSRQCVIAGNNLTAGMYCIYLSDSSNNKFYHNNIFGALYYSNSNNVWDNGYPSGGNFWEGYPYPDEKSGTSQDLPGSDRIGDIPVDEEIFSQGGTNVDNYPLMKSQSIADFDPNTIDSPSGTVVPTETPYPTTESSSSATADPTPSPSVPEFSSPILAGVLCISVLIAAFLFAKKNSKLNA